MPRSSGPSTPTAPDGSPIDPARFAASVAAALAERDLSQADLARSADVSRSSVSRYLSGALTPSREVAARVLDALELSWDDVAQAAPPAPANVVLVPRDGYASGAPSAEQGYVNGDGHAEGEPVSSALERDPYPRDELVRLTGMNPDRLRSCTVVGDSLVPEIPPNTRAVYVPVEDHIGDGLYVVAIDDAHVVKRVQRLADGTLRLLPYNPDYEPETLTPVKDADTENTYRTGTGGIAVVRFIGKVVYYPKAA
ncbi:MAG: S24 family peptidase [Bacteroidota bacterium]